MFQGEINTIDDVVKALEYLSNYNEYNYITNNVNDNKHITDRSVDIEDEETINISNIITELQLVSSGILLDENNHVYKKAKDKLAKINYTIIKSDMKEFGDYAFVGDKFRLYFNQ